MGRHPSRIFYPLNLKVPGSARRILEGKHASAVPVDHIKRAVRAKRDPRGDIQGSLVESGVGCNQRKIPGPTSAHAPTVPLEESGRFRRVANLRTRLLRISLQ